MRNPFAINNGDLGGGRGAGGASEKVEYRSTERRRLRWVLTPLRGLRGRRVLESCILYEQRLSFSLDSVKLDEKLLGRIEGDPRVSRTLRGHLDILSS